LLIQMRYACSWMILIQAIVVHGLDCFLDLSG
jgi:hypothetical protein